MQLLWPSFLAGQEMGVELALKTQAAITPVPAERQASCVKCSEIAFSPPCLYVHAHAFNPCCKAAVLSEDTVQSPSPSVSSVTAPGTSRLQFTVPPSMDWVINYAIFPRIRKQSEQQSHSSQHLLFPFTAPSVCFSPTLPCQADASDTLFIHLQLHAL